MFHYSGIKVRTSLEIGHRLVTKRPDDQFIVAHPRSGSTWLRAILVNLLDPQARSNPDIFNAMIPGVSIRKAIYKVNRLPSPRIIMSHTCYRPGIPKVVYLVRDGRDVIVSYYHYMVTRQKKTLPFEKFFKSYYQGGYGHLWHENVESWLGLGKERLGEKMMVMRFEDFKANTPCKVIEIASFLGISATREQIDEAVRLANLDQMRSIEKSRKGDLPNQNMSFYRGGKTGQWVDFLTPPIEKKFKELSSRAMGLAGYL